MKNLVRLTAVMAVALLAGALLTAHPHVQKTVSLKIGDVEAKLQYFTAPTNEKHLEGVELGKFNAGFGQLELSGDLDAGGQAIAAGKYRIGAIKNGDKDWTLVLYSGQLQPGQAADTSKMIKLKSVFTSVKDRANHVSFDLNPGEGELEGKVALVWQFGTLHLQGALS